MEAVEMKKIRLRCGMTALMCALCLLFGAVPSMAQPAEEIPVVSYGIHILAAQTDMAVSAPVGNEIIFSADAFARALNLSEVRYITVKSLPANTDGELLLGSTRIAAGQTVSAQNLPYMSFSAAADDMTHSYFTFTANGSPTVMVCNLYFMSEVNYTPTVSMASGLTLNASTYKGLALHGRLSAYDPDGDSLIYEIVSYPQNGAVLLTDREQGTYVYTPNAGYVGSDRFSYIARDKYGNYSASATVRLRVEQAGTAITYADMKDSAAYVSAIALTEAGVMSGTQVGSAYYFYPEESVSRVEFLVMAMNAVGVTEVPACDATVFADDADIEPSMKGYVHTAYELGYISGSLSGGVLSFLPDEAITRAQAAVILANMVGVSDIAVTPTFNDQSEIPVWAKDAIYSLHAVGIMGEESGYITPTAKITRAQTAQMLAAAMEYTE
ncbi:MAG: hypothetical protein E7666_04250 [Ruminococcaceae bacterium]|nr:hypothetical protein [Oscillospiraceae bacterium]